MFQALEEEGERGREAENALDEVIKREWCGGGGRKKDQVVRTG